MSSKEKNNYKSLLESVQQFYIGEISGDEFKDAYEEWATDNNIELPKYIRLLKDTAYDCEGDLIPIVEETEREIYYYDSFRRWCYLDKEKDKDSFEWWSV